jgi:methionyl-tRNA synthetase
MDRLALEGGAAAAFRVVDAANEFIAEREPWAIARDDSRAAELDAVLWNASEALRVATVLLSPIMPASATEIFSRLGLEETAAGVRLPTDSTWRSTGERQIARKDPLWPRLEEAAPNAAHLKKETTVTDQPTEPASKPTVSPPGAMPTSAGPAPAGGPPSSQADGSAATSASLWPADGRISMDDFMKVDLRVARVTAAERVANSKKLIKLEVDLGTETRTLVAGIAEAYEADTLVGRHVAIVANLKPAKLMGIESNGMVLAASPDGGKPILVTFDKEIAPGARVR